MLAFARDQLGSFSEDWLFMLLPTGAIVNNTTGNTFARKYWSTFLIFSYLEQILRNGTQRLGALAFSRTSAPCQCAW